MKTLILGASPNKDRYSYLATELLSEYGHEVIPIGIKQGNIGKHSIIDWNDKLKFDDVHTITLYLSPQNQTAYYDFIINTKPKRLIFNPGTENNELEKLAKEQGIEVVYGCTLVMLRTGSF